MKTRCRRIIILIAVILCLCSNALAMPETLVPVGKTVGIHLSGELTVVGFDEGIGAGAQAAGVRVGDRIVSVNGIRADSMEDLRTATDTEGGVYLTVERSGKNVDFYLSPVDTPEGSRIGLKVRDGITGIGTVTFYDPASGSFGALGHSVNDPETGECIPISGGSIMAASVTDVVQGKVGDPGELKGSIAREDTLGDIRSNTPAGIFGTMESAALGGRAMPLGKASQAHSSEATILSNVSGTEVEPYEVEIMKIEPENDLGRNYLLRVRDEELLAKTGGIVQGMSGSPIIQDGKLIGAVTHVLVDDPTVGYGISIEKMLDASDMV